ncbi:MAG: DUF4291 domain-containing protein [Pseudomonadota bacterium]
MVPFKQIRAIYDQHSIRVYQAYNQSIAQSALAAQRFVSPPFKMERMTWIKPSFLWMMYRAGYGFKDRGQTQILAIDITHEGFRWALEHSCGAHIPHGMSREDWKVMKAQIPVRIQWDPERDLNHAALDHRSIQIGLSGEAVKRYVNKWVIRIEDIAPTAHEIYRLMRQGSDDATALAESLCPLERPYDLIKNHEAYG